MEANPRFNTANAIFSVLICFSPLAVVFRAALYNATTAQFYFSGFGFLEKLKTWHAIYNFNRITGSTFRALPIINSHFSAPLCYIAGIIIPLFLSLAYL
jgi:hypothetical protein